MNWINTVGDKQRDLLAGFWQSVEKAASMSDLSMRAVTDVEAAHVAVKIFGNLNSGSEGMVQYPPFVSEGHRDQLYLDVALANYVPTYLCIKALKILSELRPLPLYSLLI